MRSAIWACPRNGCRPRPPEARPTAGTRAAATGPGKRRQPLERLHHAPAARCRTVRRPTKSGRHRCARTGLFTTVNAVPQWGVLRGSSAVINLNDQPTGNGWIVRGDALQVGAFQYRPFPTQPAIPRP